MSKSERMSNNQIPNRFGFCHSTLIRHSSFVLRHSATVASASLVRDIGGVKTVAIIGASSNSNKFGNKAVRAFQRQGYIVYPVHPNEPEVEGLATFKSIKDVPARPHMVSVYVPPPVLVKLLPEIAAKGCDELW